MDTPDVIMNSRSRSNVLVVEDSKTFASLLARAVKQELGLQPSLCSSYQEAALHLQEHGANYFAALLDLNLPDADKGEVVDLVVGKGIPAIVFTGELSDDLREEMWSKRIVDYVLKQSTENVHHVVGLVKRLQNNIGKKVLVADDSGATRRLIGGLLEVWNFTVLEAADGHEALEIIRRERDIALLISDYHMPGMNGIDLVKEARRDYSKSRLPIIGLSGAGGATTSAYFIKAGANDYMHKPFLTEELYCRVLHNIENSEYIATIRHLAERDFLTDIYNRRSFFNYGNKLLARCKREKLPFAVAMLDIDHFKRCNDTYGHDAGDEVIRFVASSLEAAFDPEEVVARIGGEEFCIACMDRTPNELAELFEAFRATLAETPVTAGEHEISITISAGVCVTQGKSLEAMMIEADTLLYKAKNNGRNQVRMQQE